MPESTSKICVVCNQDCSKKPRTKDSAGHYTCGECAKKKEAGAATRPASRPAPASPAPVGDDDAVMGALLAGVSVASAARCDNCGTALERDALLCVRCGYDTRTGKVHAVMVTKAPKESGIGKAAGGLASAGGAVVKSDAVSFLLGIVLSLVGGVLAAILWAFAAQSMELSARMLARMLTLLIGIGAGGGMFLGARHVTSWLTGLIAAVIAFFSCIGAHAFYVNSVLDPIVEQARSSVRVTDEYAIAYLGQSVAQAHEFSNVAWPEGVDPAHAWTEFDFPEVVWKAAKARYEALDTERKAQHREMTQQAMDATFEEAIDAIREEGVAMTIGIADLVGFAFAIVIGYSLGSKEA